MLIDLAWLRGDETVEGIIKLGSRPFRPLETAIERDVRENLLVPLFGMRVEKSGKNRVRAELYHYEGIFGLHGG